MHADIALMVFCGGEMPGQSHSAHSASCLPSFYHSALYTMLQRKQVSKSRYTKQETSQKRSPCSRSDLSPSTHAALGGKSESESEKVKIIYP